jgi:ADP-ribose pyrophosphatase YjhB (NUDIX family)/predicted transcriptional regulator
MSHEIEIHKAQTAILRELLFNQMAGYAELQKQTGLTSDHFNFHISRLVELGFVGKVGRGKYQLTEKGKEYSNRLDTDSKTIERQPKVAVMLIVERLAGDRAEYLFQQRLKHPYFGFWGRPTGKIRWGESIIETAARELKEEAGLEARHEVLGVNHERVFEKGSHKLLEDKLFFMVRCCGVKGRLVEQFEGGKNKWMTKDEIALERKSFGDFEEGFRMLGDKGRIIETEPEYTAEVF